MTLAASLATTASLDCDNRAPDHYPSRQILTYQVTADLIRKLNFAPYEIWRYDSMANFGRQPLEV